MLPMAYWSFVLGLVILPAFIPLLFINLPVAATLELMVLTFIIYLVILPSYNGGWEMYSSSNVGNEIEGNPDLTNFCGDQVDQCLTLFQNLFQLPLTLTLFMMISIIIAALYME